MAKGDINNLQFNQSAGFYKLKNPGKKLRGLQRVLSEASPRGVGNQKYYLFEVRNPVNIDGKTILFSLCVFKYTAQSPLFINEEKGYEEKHIGYLLVVEYGKYVAISKRGVGEISCLTDQIVQIQSDALCNSFIDDTTNIERLAMRNLNASDGALRAKSMEGLDLRQSYSGYGANRNLVRSVRISTTTSHRKSVTTSTSFIMETGLKVSIDKYIKWIKNVVDAIDNYVPHKTFLDIFAKRIDYVDFKDNLTPVSILFYQEKLLEDIESGYISSVFFHRKHGEYPINIDERLRKFERCLNIRKDDGAYFVDNNVDSSLQLIKGAASLFLSSSKLFKYIFLRLSSGKDIKLITYLNQQKCFSVYFLERDIVYNNNLLLQDSLLLESIPQFLDVFIEVPELERVYSEKGNIANNLNAFENQTVFRCTEDRLCNQNHFKFGLLDDLGNEWADHIGIGEDCIAFFVEKCKTSDGSSKAHPKSPHFSASAFQDVVAQAEKNLGNLLPIDHLLEDKKSFWKETYNNNGVKTIIPRLLFGTSVDDAIHKWKELKRSPNLQTEMNLVVNFISKRELQDKLNHLHDEHYDVAFRNEVMQILWLVSSLINCAHEVGAKVHIYCKP